MSKHFQGYFENTSHLPQKKLIFTSTALVLAVPAVGIAYYSYNHPYSSAESITKNYTSSLHAVSRDNLQQYVQPANSPRDTSVNDTGTTIDVTVNGEQIVLPTNGTIFQNIETDSESVDIHATTSSQSTTTSRSSVDILVESSSTSGNSTSNNTTRSTQVNITQQ